MNPKIERKEKNEANSWVKIEKEEEKE